MVGWRVGGGWVGGGQQSGSGLCGGWEEEPKKYVHGCGSVPLQADGPGALRVFSGLPGLFSLWGCPARLRGRFLWKVS